MSDNDIQRVVIAVLNELGLTGLEISHRQACARYGRWFRDAAKVGAIRPARVGARARWYRVADIMAYEGEQRGRAVAQLKEISNTKLKEYEES